MADSTVRFGVIGVAHFAGSHINYITKLSKTEDIELSALYIRNPQKYSEEISEFKERGIAIFHTYEEFLEEGRVLIDIVTVPTSIPSHAPLSIQAMEAGYNVLCEKPPAPTIQELDEMIACSERTGRFCAIGFQNIYSHSIRRLKKMLVNGELGRLERIACKGYWPRFKTYYNRNPWAGEFKFDGEYTLDGPLNNALAHYLFNMLYLAGETLDQSAPPKTVRAELYRGHTYITAEDTSCVKVKTVNDVDINFYVTHCSPNNIGPYMEIETSDASVKWNFDQATEITTKSGETIEFGDGGFNRNEEVFRVAARAHRGEIARPYCFAENTRSFVLSLNGAYESSQAIRQIPDEYVEEFWTDDDEYKTVVDNIEDYMDQAFERRCLLSDIDVPWSQSTEAFPLEDYSEFDLDVLE